MSATESSEAAGAADSSETAMPTKPLEGLLVLDLTRALAGPIAGRLLSDLGAEVIKVEPPAGDLTRMGVPRVDGLSAYYAQCNVGKRCVSMDLTSDDGRELFLRMVDQADIVLENYRADVMGRLGMDYETLAAHNPRIILASVSGWGHGNSRSHQGAFAAAIQAEAGITHNVARRRGDVPRNDPVSHADVYAGLHALAGLLAALYVRERTGRGQSVEVSMAESSLIANDLTTVDLTGEDPTEGFRMGTNWPPIYRLGTGRYVCVTADPAAPGAFRIWCRAMGREDLAEDPRFETATARIENADALDEIVGEWVAGFDDPRELERVMDEGSVIAAEVRPVTEVPDMEWADERGAFVDVDAGNGGNVRIPQSPWRFSHAEAGLVPTLGYRGEHNRDVLVDRFGFDGDEIDALTESGVLSARPPKWKRP